ncbi:phage major capsid family protein [Bradyrhizobium cenepequi]
MNQTARIPLRPDPGALRARAAALVPQAAVVALLACLRKRYRDDILRTCYPDARDLAPLLSTKAAVTPTSTTAQTLTMLAVPSFVSALGPTSVLSELLNASGAQYIFDGSNLISVNALIRDAATTFVGELDPIPVRAFALGGITLAYRTLKSISVFTREALSHSLPNVEVTVRNALGDNTSLAGETAMLDANPATAARPAGLLLNIAATPGQSANPDKAQALREDVKLIMTTLAPIAGNAPVILVASATQAWALKLMGDNLPFTVLMSSAVAPGVVIGIASNALATAFDPTPVFEVADQGTLHLDDAPAQISIAGTPNAISAPVIDLWQQDCLALKASFGVSWGLRNAGGICWIQNVVW